MKTETIDALIIGGGFFGLYIAEYLRNNDRRVMLLENETEFMKRASYVNQARVHNGYHYPRSILTALRSRVSFPRFCEDFSDCIVSSFDQYYAIGKILGKVTARQFELFCDTIGAFCEPAPHSIRKLFNPSLIEAVFLTRESAFDAVKLRRAMLSRLDLSGVDCRLGTSVESLRPELGDKIRVRAKDSRGVFEVTAGEVFNCTYSRTNYVLRSSGLPPIPLKHEITELCLVTLPSAFSQTGVTVMCGPFFSTMPFPPEDMHSFSHVRYTPHFEWHDDEAHDEDPYAVLDRYKKVSAWQHMVHDAQRYVPLFADCEYHKSIWEVKTILPRSETDDSRPILFMRDHGMKNLHCILGGKIDNVYDVVEAIKTYA